jgi:coiled-coil domain-containing protein 77
LCALHLQALSDAQQFLFEERERLLLLQAENDELKLQEVQDRQRIQQLLAMTQPIEQTIQLKQVRRVASCFAA